MKNLNLAFNKTSPFINTHSLSPPPVSSPSSLITPAIQANLGGWCEGQGSRSASEHCGFLVIGFLECLTWQNGSPATTSSAYEAIGCGLRCWDTRTVNGVKGKPSVQISVKSALFISMSNAPSIKIILDYKTCYIIKLKRNMVKDFFFSIPGFKKAKSEH